MASRRLDPHGDRRCGVIRVSCHGGDRAGALARTEFCADP